MTITPRERRFRYAQFAWPDVTLILNRGRWVPIVWSATLTEGGYRLSPGDGPELSH